MRVTSSPGGALCSGRQGAGGAGGTAAGEKPNWPSTRYQAESTALGRGALCALPLKSPSGLVHMRLLIERSELDLRL